MKKQLIQSYTRFCICLFINGSNISLKNSARHIEAVGYFLNSIFSSNKLFKYLGFTRRKAVMLGIVLHYLLLRQRFVFFGGFLCGSLLRKKRDADVLKQHKQGHNREDTASRNKHYASELLKHHHHRDCGKCSGNASNNSAFFIVE